MTRARVTTVGIGLLGFAMFVCCAGAPQEQQEAENRQWEREEQKQDARLEMIEKLIDQGVFRDVQIREQGATIIADPQFLLLNFDEKQTFTNVVYSYVSTQARSNYIVVEVREHLNNKRIGSHSATGLVMD